MPSRSHSITFGGQQLQLDGSGALYWPSQRMLIVSDMHLEKSTFLAAHGSFIPPYDTMDTLNRLEQLLAHYQPDSLVFLGDSFHDRNAWARLDATLRHRLETLCSSVNECHWIEGNHDVVLSQHTLNPFQAHRQVENLMLSHEHVKGIASQIIGHFHPKVTVSLKGKRLNGKCFLYTDRLIIMPAFGSYTGGLDIAHPAFEPFVRGNPTTLYLLHQQRIYPVSLR